MLGQSIEACVTGGKMFERSKRGRVVWAATMVTCCLSIASGGTPRAGEPVDLEMVTRIRDEGIRHSKVMETLAYLTDVIGPRLTGSPELKEANEWTRDRLTEWGLENATLEPYEFGRGWSFSRTSVHMLAPREVPLFALPKAWSSPTKGKIRGDVARVKIEGEKDLEKYRGELKGKIVFLDDAREIEPPDSDMFRRYSDDQLTELAAYEMPGGGREDWRKRAEKRWKTGKLIRDFLLEEKALATVEISSRDRGVVRLGGTRAYLEGEDPGVPAIVMVAEQYNRILRLIEDDHEVELEISVDAEFHDDDPMAYNTIAEIPGTGNEVVMVGAHLDSWHPGTGATDNAAGCAVAMEAVRILKLLGVEPKRTIRIALWSGEEQGLLGSRAYVKQHFATRPESDDPDERTKPRFLREQLWPITTRPEFETLSAYFNLDNGSGKIRGIYSEENAAARPIFEAWLAPFADLGATTVTLRRTGGTDHMSFDAVGLPGFQFIQDGLDYRSQTHHTNLDVFDHLQADDMKQASVIMASFLYHAATREESMPRKPMPRERPDEKRDRDKEKAGE
jgi:hypothetical protein